MPAKTAFSPSIGDLLKSLNLPQSDLQNQTWLDNFRNIIQLPETSNPVNQAKYIAERCFVLLGLAKGETTYHKKSDFSQFPKVFEDQVRQVAAKHKLDILWCDENEKYILINSSSFVELENSKYLATPRFFVTVISFDSKTTEISSDLQELFKAA